jgi:hypothetical protein
MMNNALCLFECTDRYRDLRCASCTSYPNILEQFLESSLLGLKLFLVLGSHFIVSLLSCSKLEFMGFLSSSSGSFSLSFSFLLRFLGGFFFFLLLGFSFLLLFLRFSLRLLDIG